jgi:two-component system, OmpR family, sensor histidine kinase SenX3
VDPATQAFLAALLGAAVAGGAVLAWHISDRQQSEQPMAPEPLLPPGVAAVLSVLRSSAVVVDSNDNVVKASAPAYAMGFVRGTVLTSDDLTGLVADVRRDGQISEAEIIVSRHNGPDRNVTARVAPLGSRLVLALLEDRTRERRVEAVRRDFVANVSHELKTPVGAIKVLAEAVHDSSDDPEAVERFANRMVIESDRLSQLVQQVIELSRLQGDEPIESPTPVSVDEVIAAAIDTTAIDAGAREIETLTEGDVGLKVAGNEEQITAAVANLVANAVNYSERGSRVLVSARPVEDYVEISVVDQGIGIPRQEIDRIFERFYRVDPARHRSTGGTGLGLSIVKHVAATHGGDVRVWSVEGQGSTFTLSLPRAPRSGAASSRAEEEEVPADSPPDQEDREERP